ncbi:hypothetical protein ACLVWU_01115 [Bdellovibrio sp. HCB290]|uniref:hypothetical protein n=1 Tax=Bdellovibrio sp. HCB290 TaxID=3394356 RepID=UPI0039B38925
MNIIRFMLVAVLFSVSLPALAIDKSFRCHGRAYEQGFFFRYSIELHSQGSSRSRLTTSSGYNESMDYGWREISTPKYGKFAVDSPFHEYKAFLTQEENHFSLILVDPVTSASVEPPPYDRFVCVTDL